LFFAFDTEPRYGYVLFAFDTFENNIRSAQQMEQYLIKDRTESLTKKRHWNNAKHRLCHPPVTVFNTNIADFAFPQYADVGFPEWETIAKNGGMPKQYEHDDDYLKFECAHLALEHRTTSHRRGCIQGPQNGLPVHDRVWDPR